MFWGKVSELESSASQEKAYPVLSRLAKLALLLPHGNSDVERGFSLNNSVLTDERSRLSHRSLVAVRFLKDVVINKFNSDLSSVVVSRRLLNSVQQSHAKYEEFKKEQKSKELEKQALRQKQTEAKMAERKRKASAAQELAAVQSELNDLNEKRKAGEKFLMEGTKRLKSAKGDATEALVAQQMI